MLSSRRSRSGRFPDSEDAFDPEGVPTQKVSRSGRRIQSRGFPRSSGHPPLGASCVRAVGPESEGDTIGCACIRVRCGARRCLQRKAALFLLTVRSPDALPPFVAIVLRRRSGAVGLGLPCPAVLLRYPCRPVALGFIYGVTALRCRIGGRLLRPPAWRRRLPTSPRAPSQPPRFPVRCHPSPTPVRASDHPPVSSA